ncbi:MAG: hypothetical protein JXR48_01410 [Candidatus Delongbacteria bacterium]|nr:hypothetical protein [Candidatus Delongbacteria bacterium]
MIEIEFLCILYKNLNKDYSISKLSVKYLLLEEIERIKVKSNYFSVESVRDFLKSKKRTVTNPTINRYLHDFKKKGIIFDAGKGWYSFLENPFLLYSEPVKPFVEIIKEGFPLLPFSCWSTQQLNSFTHHLLAKFIVFVYTDSDYMRNVSTFFKDKGYNVFENPIKAEVNKLFTMSENTIVIRPSISKQPSSENKISPIEKILIDFIIENQKLSIMDLPEAEYVIKSIINSGRINISELLSYAKRRNLNSASIINYVLNNINVELID